MPSLVEKLREQEGEVGNYAWSVQVWRADTTAVANLRVRLKIHRIKEMLWGFSRVRAQNVYTNTETCSSDTLEEHWQAQLKKAEQLSTRFNNEKAEVENLDA